MDAAGPGDLTEYERELMDGAVDGGLRMSRDKTLGIVVHHMGVSSDTPNLARSLETVEYATARDVDVWHEQRGFRLLVHRADYEGHEPAWLGWTTSDEAVVHGGYHAVIRSDGLLDRLRPWGAIGAHCKAGHRNATHVGVCLAGARDHRPVPEAQRATLVRVLVDLCRRYSLAADTIEGHCQVPGASTECPGRHALALLPEIRAEVARQLV